MKMRSEPEAGTFREIFTVQWHTLQKRVRQAFHLFLFRLNKTMSNPSSAFPVSPSELAQCPALQVSGSEFTVLMQIVMDFWDGAQNSTERRPLQQVLNINQLSLFEQLVMKLRVYEESCKSYIATSRAKQESQTGVEEDEKQ
jgi:hypothetical protein